VKLQRATNEGEIKSERKFQACTYSDQNPFSISGAGIYLCARVRELFIFDGNSKIRLGSFGFVRKMKSPTTLSWE